MYDKTVRRRRAVLGLLVACSLILLTVSFGGSGGAVGSVQRGVNEVLNPVQEGASRALKPVRDLFGWFGTTLEAKGQLDRVTAERDRLRQELVRHEGAVRQNAELRRQAQLESSLGLQEYEPLSARVIGQTANLWYSTVEVNKGASDGVRPGMAVVTGEGLVGKVSTTTRGSAFVTLITDQSSAVAGRVNRSGLMGIVATAGAGNPTDLIFDLPSDDEGAREGDRIVTAGTRSRTERLASPFPPGLPIGEVTRVEDPGSDTQEIHLRPFADLRRVELVRILTSAPRSNRP